MRRMLLRSKLLLLSFINAQSLQARLISFQHAEAMYKAVRPLACGSLRPSRCFLALFRRAPLALRCHLRQERNLTAVLPSLDTFCGLTRALPSGQSSRSRKRVQKTTLRNTTSRAEQVRLRMGGRVNWNKWSRLPPIHPLPELSSKAGLQSDEVVKFRQDLAALKMQQALTLSTIDRRQAQSKWATTRTLKLLILASPHHRLKASRIVEAPPLVSRVDRQ